MDAAAFLVITRDTTKKGTGDKPASDSMLLTANEIRKLFNHIAAPPPAHHRAYPALSILATTTPCIKPAPATIADEATICRCSTKAARKHLSEIT
jgi:hypothetical protein